MEEEPTEPVADETTVPDSIIQECREAFALFDRNADGVISFEELSSVMRLLGNNPTEEELSRLMSDLDTDQSGGVEVDDFLRVLGRHWKEPVDEQRELQDAFAMFDRNNDGFVNADEIKFVMTRLGHALSDADVDDILRDADTNGDGKLDYTEFVKLMQK